MSLARIQMTPLPKARKRQIEFSADSYVMMLNRNGQVIDSSWSYAWQGGILYFYVEIPRPDSLESKYNSEWVQHAHDALVKLLSAPPTWIMMEDVQPQRYPSLKSAPFLYLSPAWAENPSPVHRGSDGRPIPLYLLPIDQDDRQAIVFWQRHAEAYSFLWHQCGAMEIPAWRQMSEPASEHSKNGRKICQWIEGATSIPTYYELDRFYAHAEGEASRPCPVCGQPWSIPQRWPGKEKVWDFAFKCDPCRLVSHLGTFSNFEDDPARDERLARIGDYHPRKPRK